MKKILIDGRFIGVGESISRYVLEITKGILDLDKENSYTLLVRPQGEKMLKTFFPSKIPNLEIKVLDIPHYSFAEQKDLLQYLNQAKFDLVHFTQFNHPILYRGSYVTTIHDLTLLGHLHYFNFAKQIAFKAVMKSAAYDSQKIIAISNTTKDEVKEHFCIPEEKFSVIYHGLDHQKYNQEIKNKKAEIKKFKEKYKIKNNYILYTGMWKKHKNLLRMLKAFEQLLISKPSSEVQLVLVGKIDKEEPEVLEEINRINESLATNYKLQAPIIATGFIDEEELPISYAGALAYCIPSLAEGFGWPPLEAMACGTPVIASKESCIPEILGKAPLYFDPYNIEDIKKTMERVVADPKLQQELSQKGLVQVKKYNWEECAQKTLNVYKEVLKIK